MSQVLTSAMTGASVKNVLTGIPTQNAYNPPSPEQACTLIMGFRGQFKSSFCMSNPEAIVLDWEDGCRSVTTRKAKAVIPIVISDGEGVDTSWLKMSPWQRYEKTRDALLEGARTGNRPGKTVVLDTLDGMIEYSMRKFCRDKNVESPGDYGASNKGSKGWYLVRDAFMSEFHAFKDAGYGVWVPLHLRNRTISTKDGDVLVPEPWVQESVRGALFKAVDQILTIELVQDVEQIPVERTVAGRQISTKETRHVTKVRLRTVPIARNSDVKTRIYIPDKLELSMDDPCEEYFKVYREEVERVKQKSQAKRAA